MNVLKHINDLGIQHITDLHAQTLDTFYKEIFQGPARTILKKLGDRAGDHPEYLVIELEEVEYIIAFHCGLHSYREYEVYRYSSAVRLAIVLMIEGAVRCKSPDNIFSTMMAEALPAMKRYRGKLF